MRFERIRVYKGEQPNETENKRFGETNRRRREEVGGEGITENEDNLVEWKVENASKWTE